MQPQLTVNDALESLSTLSLDDQLMVSEILRNRAIEERRREIADSIRISREEYAIGNTEHGSVDDFLARIEKDECERSVT